MAEGTIGDDLERLGRELERFATLMIEGHRSGDDGRCGMCQQWAPCSTERAAMDAGLIVERRWLSTGGPRWAVSETRIGELLCEDWLMAGEGHIVVFSRSAVEADQAPAEPMEPHIRSAWAAAKEYARTHPASPHPAGMPPEGPATDAGPGHPSGGTVRPIRES